MNAERSLFVVAGGVGTGICMHDGGAIATCMRFLVQGFCVAFVIVLGKLSQLQLCAIDECLLSFGPDGFFVIWSVVNS